MIPPLDGLILNYRKLDQWKEQKHFRVQLEAQRIFEQQLQQEHNLNRMIPPHHHNSLTVHAMSSPKQKRPFQVVNAGSTNFSGTGAGVEDGTGSGALTSMFSPPLSLNHPSISGKQQRGDQEKQFPHHQIQTKLQSSINNLRQEQKTDTIQETLSNCRASRGSSNELTSTHDSNTEYIAIGRGKGRLIQNHVHHEEQSISEAQKQQSEQPLQSDKRLPPSVTSEFDQLESFALSPPPARHQSMTGSEPGSPLQYLNVGGEDPVEMVQSSALDVTPGNKTEVQGGHEKTRENNGHVDDYILKSATHPTDLSSQHLTRRQPITSQPSKLDQQQFPLRTTNKPAPPHDPFRKTSASLTHSTQANLLSNLASVTSTNPVQPNSIAKSGRTHYQSLYQPPEPPCQGDKIHPLQLHHTKAYYNDPSVVVWPRVPPADDNRRIPMPLTATGHILSSIGGISGCYAIVGGVPRTAALVAPAAAAPMDSFSLQDPQNHHTFRGPHFAAPSTSRQPNSTSQQHHYQQQQQKQSIRQQPQAPKQQQQRHDVPKRYMPDIVLTLPTPAETGNASRREEYFAV
ncbi:hypothetical protein BGX27_006782 [Mortierella sp. AM989]|nr:hypothetical protein BGX27_006782 [Mortierella sp. AM989]